MIPSPLGQKASVPDGKSRMQFVDELRAIGVLIVVAFHAAPALLIPADGFGVSGVDLFIMESGFSLVIWMSSATVREFIKRRLLRLIPSYWIALTLFIIVGRNFWDAPGWQSIVLHYLGLHGFSDPHYFFQVAAAFWFMSAIVMSSTIFLIVRKRVNDIPFMAFACGALSCLAVFAYNHFHHEPGLHEMTPTITGFFIGMVAAGAYKRGFVRSGRPIVIDALLLAAGAVGMYLAFKGGLRLSYIPHVLATIAAWFGLRYLLIRTRWGSAFVNGLGALGLIAYEIYLFHHPLVQGYNRWVLAHWFGIENPTLVSLWAETIGALCLCYILSKLTNKLSMAIKRKFS